MNYHVLLNEELTIYLSNIESVRNEEETIIFFGEGGNIVGAFKMYNIVGFYRVDVPTEAGIKISEMMESARKASKAIGESLTKLKEPTETKEERKTIAKESAKREIKKQLREVAEILKRDIQVYGEIMAECTEVAAEAMERHTYAKGDDLYMYERKILRELLNENMDKCIGD